MSPQHELDALRREMLAALDDCQGPACSRLRVRLQCVPSAYDLWLARVDVFHVVAQQHCESRASERIAALNADWCSRPG